MARPFMSPLDGRVADINRRITDAHQSVAVQSEQVQAQLGILKGELTAYTAATAESGTFIGVELRRFEELLQEMRDSAEHQVERLREQIETHSRAGYMERLDHAAHASLERLDEGIANLVNYATGHRGFAAQAGLWFNPPVTAQLGKGEARLAGVNERIAEIPFAMGALARLKPPARILDIGAAESTFSLSAASLGYRVTALDLHPLPYAHPLLETVVERFEDWHSEGERYDAVFLISTIEHVGLGAYGEPAGERDADLAMVKRVRDELLKDDGFLLLTTPYGPSHQNALERTYDNARLGRLLAGWDVVEQRVVVRQDERTWVPLGERPNDTRGVVMVLATPASGS
jgi:2-polyprenyl-3-methyl-5-hydroxy-6-metoxy-1,4-benzoquinol methylase